MTNRSCTCHPDDSPPFPCPRKYALSECRAAAPPAVQGEPTDQLIARLRSLASELDADDSPEQIHPGSAICSQAADMLEAFRLQRDLNGPAWERHVERMRLAEDEVQRLKAAPPAVQSMEQRLRDALEAMGSKKAQTLTAGDLLQVVSDVDALPAVRGEPVALDRWGIKSVPGRPEDYWFEKMPDGYWTPWHIANEALQRAALPAVNPAPGYCPHCKQYTIAEPLPADDETVKLLTMIRPYVYGLDNIKAIDAYLAKAKC